MAIKVTDLRHVGAERLGKAVQHMIERQSAGPTSRHRLPGTEQLRAGAEATRGGADDQQVRTFQSILELGYLVASADGFADEERRALAALLEQATGAAVNRQDDQPQQHQRCRGEHPLHDPAPNGYVSAKRHGCGRASRNCHSARRASHPCARRRRFRADAQRRVPPRPSSSS